ncbi:MAG: phosphoribosylanthranilate isomerase [Boseongicola sp.]|nr:phosphoribosylanthranilate isomerase [Boseongicola sp.]
MTHITRVKICGLSTPDTLSAAADAGAAYVGFVFFEKSPRNVGYEQARALAIDVPMGVAKVALTVNATDTELDQLTAHVPLDMLQLHGSESPERVAEVRQKYGLPVMKAVGISAADDLENIQTYSEVADQILVDAKPPKGGDLPGGNGLAFDWRLISDLRWTKPWMLAGGLTPSNAAQAVNLTGARQLDVSSGVESSPGVKDSDLIRAFIQAAG